MLFAANLIVSKYNYYIIYIIKYIIQKALCSYDIILLKQNE